MTLKQLLLITTATLSFSLSAQDTTIKVGTTGEYAPWNFMENGKPVGYDVDVANAVCEVQGLNCEMTIQPWGRIFDSLRFKKNDVLAASVYVTEAREKILLFSDLYATMQAQFIVKKDNPLATLCQKGCEEVLQGVDLTGKQKETLEKLQKALAGKTLTTVEKSGQSAALSNLFPGMNVQTFKTFDDSVKAVMDGKADLAFVGSIGAIGLMEKYGNNQLMLLPTKFEGGNLGKGVAFVFRKDEADLQEKFNQGLKILKENNKLKELSEKWFNVDVSPK